MKMIDINPNTSKKTEQLIASSVRILYSDGSHYDYKLDHRFSGERSQHPYIKDYLSNVDKSETQQILVLNQDGTERLGPVTIPQGKLAVFRMRTRGGSVEGIKKFIIIGIVDKSSQVLHFLDIEGKQEIISSPEQNGPTGKIVLMEEELARL